MAAANYLTEIVLHAFFTILLKSENIGFRGVKVSHVLFYDDLKLKIVLWHCTNTKFQMYSITPVRSLNVISYCQVYL